MQMLCRLLNPIKEREGRAKGKYKNKRETNFENEEKNAREIFKISEK